MRKRLRKKLGVGEFRLLQCDLRFALADGIDDAGRDAFLNRFLEEAVAAAGAVFGGGGDREWEGVLELGLVKDVEDPGARRDAVAAWLEAASEVSEHEIGEVVATSLEDDVRALEAWLDELESADSGAGAPAGGRSG